MNWWLRAWSVWEFEMVSLLWFQIALCFCMFSSYWLAGGWEMCSSLYYHHERVGWGVKGLRPSASLIFCFISAPLDFVRLILFPMGYGVVLISRGFTPIARNPVQSRHDRRFRDMMPRHLDVRSKGGQSSPIPSWSKALRFHDMMSCHLDVRCTRGRVTQFLKVLRCKGSHLKAHKTLLKANKTLFGPS